MWDLHTNNNPPPCVLTLSSPGIVTPNKLRFDADQTSPLPPPPPPPPVLGIYHAANPPSLVNGTQQVVSV